MGVRPGRPGAARRAAAGPRTRNDSSTARSTRPCPDVRAVVHCHTPSLIPFCNSTVPLRPMFHMSFFVAEGIPVFEIRTTAGMTDLLVRDAKLGKALAVIAGRTSRSRSCAITAPVVVANLDPERRRAGASIWIINARVQIQTDRAWWQGDLRGSGGSQAAHDRPERVPRAPGICGSGRSHAAASGSVLRTGRR